MDSAHSMKGIALLETDDFHVVDVHVREFTEKFRRALSGPDKLWKSG
jgi:hypothetical protein